MTMGDESLFASMAVPVILGPIFEKLEKRDLGAAQTLRNAVIKVENEHPGFSYNFIKGILHKAELLDSLDMTECLLRLEGINNSREFIINRPEQHFLTLNDRSTNLKRILSRIPTEINDRKKFLETIKDIASAIKNLLDAVNNIFMYVDQAKRQVLEKRKREFVKYSKNFSNTLKDFFKDNQKHDVFYSANHLTNQTNLIMKTVKELC